MTATDLNPTLMPCPCCGRRTITELGNYEICPVCRWEDDPVQSEDPNFSGGANELSLHLAKIRWGSNSPGEA
ncbi:CPCC family cysteine-rich protein [Xanthomonas campestris]|uniref:CPCC family cysteine-rich protein n=1 Tax=Xanthomonas cannabis TaxID=1885674 RepID=UPI001ABAF1ED